MEEPIYNRLDLLTTLAQTGAGTRLVLKDLSRTSQASASRQTHKVQRTKDVEALGRQLT